MEKKSLPDYWVAHLALNIYHKKPTPKLEIFKMTNSYGHAT